MESGLRSFGGKIVKFAKNLTLSADDKVLREEGLMTECGDYSPEAKEIVMNKICSDNKTYLVEIASAAKAEEKSKK